MIKPEFQTCVLIITLSALIIPTTDIKQRIKMQLTVVPASSQVCQVALRALLAQDSSHKVVGIYRDLGKVPSNLKSHPNFRAIRGNLAEAETIDFRGSDAVLVTTPAAFASPDVSAHNKRITDNVRNAVTKAGSVKRLVYVSSVGAQYHEGVGEVKSNYDSERAYCGVAPEVVFVRNSYFMDNWRPAIDTVKSERPFFFSPILPIDFKIPMTLNPPAGFSTRHRRNMCDQASSYRRRAREYPQIINVQGPERYSTKDVKDALESIVGKGVEVRPVDKDALPSFFGQVLPSHLVPEFVEMTTSVLPGGVLELESAAITDWRVGNESLVAALTRMWHE